MKSLTVLADLSATSNLPLTVASLMEKEVMAALSPSTSKAAVVPLISVFSPLTFTSPFATLMAVLAEIAPPSMVRAAPLKSMAVPEAEPVTLAPSPVTFRLPAVRLMAVVTSSDPTAAPSMVQAAYVEAVMLFTLPPVRLNLG